MLFTGSGRHRRRTQAEKAVAVVGVAGVGIALPLMAATGASAAPVSTWDKVAQCESGGNWSINTGNGFYGGLQFTSSTWAGFGGKAYAAQANQATKGQQIEIAEKVLASQGPGAWPVCSVKAGLTKGGAPAQVDTKSETKASRSESRPAAPKTEAPKAAPKVETPKAAAPKTTAPKAEAPKAAPQQQAAPKVETPKAAAPTVNAPKHAAPKTPAAGNYTVQAGDTLSGIAAAKGQDWHQVYQANQSVVGGNPDLIYPGQVLQLG
ncbi:transglycosylase family protein [Kitasatospora sp. NPDC096147]|uniref:transglycosylase family protein n=1 Tax=Kitasatospora sp. NPDC096147 TaxID=3364093 RepID=UPI00382F05F0